MRPPLLALAVLLLAPLARAEVAVSINRHAPDEAAPGFEFPDVPRPAKDDAGSAAKFTVIDGELDNGRGTEALHDGLLPTEPDQPARNFFFGRSDGGRIVIDLGRAIEVKQVNSYSWHPGSRGPQVYVLYASEGAAAGFNAAPKRPLDPASAGWKLLARVDTRKAGSPPGGQYGVSIGDQTGSLGRYRYLLLDISRTETTDIYGNTFYSEIDVIDRDAPPTAPTSVAEAQSYQCEGGKQRFTIDTSETPELTEWAHQELAPVVQKWYPKIETMLPSDGFTAPTRFSIAFSKEKTGVASTTGTRITGAEAWYLKNMHGEGVGSMVHELVHVVQHYGKGQRPPGWLIEGIPDYIRFYLYEPQTHGADIPPGKAASAHYDAAYRTSANFLHWVMEKYDRELIRKLNAAMREGTYDDSLWKTLTGHGVSELADEWKQALTQAKPTAGRP